MLVVPGGAFTMGSAHIDEAEAPNPPHGIVLSDFVLATHPVTNAQYRVYVTETSAAEPAGWSDPRFARPEQPVVGVSWDEAIAYCGWAGGVLPSEAQWERAARGDDGRRHPWGDASPDEERACFAEDWNSGTTAPIGTHPAGRGPYGHEDLAGNVWEWCLDAWALNAHEERSILRTNPLLRSFSMVRPLRGGCWRSIDCKLQGAYRNWAHHASRHTTIGFRLCMPKPRVP